MAAGNKSQTHGAHTEVAKGSNFPPFDTTTFSPQLVWLAICFVALYLFLSRIALPRVSTLLDQRNDRISRDLEEAKRLKEETEKAIASYEQALSEARAKANTIAQETRNSIEAEVNKERNDVENQIAAKIADAEKRINDAKDSALAQVNQVASDTTKALVEKLINVDVAQNDVDDAVQSAIKAS